MAYVLHGSNFTMEPSAVVLSFSHPSTSSSISGTGILFDGGLILTNGSILVPLLLVPSQRRWLKLFVSSLKCTLEPNSGLTNNVQFRALKDPSSEEPAAVSVQGAWKCPLVSRSVKNLFHDWTMGDVNRSPDPSVDADLAKELMAVFIVLGELSDRTDSETGVLSVLRSCGQPRRGQEIVVESTPFGLDLFFNSLSRGIISNVMGIERCLLLTDARTVTGCEGGPIFGVSDLRLSNEEKGKLVGVVSCSLTWWRGEWVGLSIGIALEPVIRRLARTPLLLAHHNPSPNIENALNDGPGIVDDTVVLVRCGCSWGSGVVVDATMGILLTCSHVVKNEKTDKVNVFFRGEAYPADVVFRTTDNLAYDIAVLRVRQPHPFTEQIELDTQLPDKGDTVIAAGFPLFSEREDRGLLPTLVHGCVARVCPSMVQTTCCIQSGASGGPIIRNDKLIGLVVCNAKDSATGALFPHVSFAIPVTAFRQQISRYIDMDDVSCLQTLQAVEGKVQTLWKLQSSKL